MTYVSGWVEQMVFVDLDAVDQTRASDLLTALSGREEWKWLARFEVECEGCFGDDGC